MISPGSGKRGRFSLERIPPGQRLTTDFPVLHLGPVPAFRPESWDFRVGGAVAKPVVLGWPELSRLPMVTVTADFHCVTGWSRLDLTWEGVAFSAIASLAQPRPEARSVLIHCEYGYTTNLPLENLMQPDVLFALRVEGEPLTAEHGGPVRLVVPQKYAYKSAKWVRGVEFREAEVLGYWEARGYSNTADPWTEDRYAPAR
ncbi:MAG: sulfite oxidase-like oxidoreductase [Chloroflexota bacterium]